MSQLAQYFNIPHTGFTSKKTFNKKVWNAIKEQQGERGDFVIGFSEFGKLHKRWEQSETWRKKSEGRYQKEPKTKEHAAAENKARAERFKKQEGDTASRLLAEEREAHEDNASKHIPSYQGPSQAAAQAHQGGHNLRQPKKQGLVGVSHMSRPKGSVSERMNNRHGQKRSRDTSAPEVGTEEQLNKRKRKLEESDYKRQQQKLQEKVTGPGQEELLRQKLLQNPEWQKAQHESEEQALRQKALAGWQKIHPTGTQKDARVNNRVGQFDAVTRKAVGGQKGGAPLASREPDANMYASLQNEPDQVPQVPSALIREPDTRPRRKKAQPTGKLADSYEPSWECGKCTYLNKGGHLACGMCGTDVDELRRLKEFQEGGWTEVRRGRKSGGLAHPGQLPGARQATGPQSQETKQAAAQKRAATKQAKRSRAAQGTGRLSGYFGRKGGGGPQPPQPPPGGHGPAPPQGGIRKQKRKSTGDTDEDEPDEKASEAPPRVPIGSGQPRRGVSLAYQWPQAPQQRMQAMPVNPANRGAALHPSQLAQLPQFNVLHPPGQHYQQAGRPGIYPSGRRPSARSKRRRGGTSVYGQGHQQHYQHAGRAGVTAHIGQGLPAFNQRFVMVPAPRAGRGALVAGGRGAPRAGRGARVAGGRGRGLGHIYAQQQAAQQLAAQQAQYRAGLSLAGFNEAAEKRAEWTQQQAQKYSKIFGVGNQRSLMKSSGLKIVVVSPGHYRVRADNVDEGAIAQIKNLLSRIKKRIAVNGTPVSKSKAYALIISLMRERRTVDINIL